MSIFYINPFNIYDEDAAAYINAVESADGQTLETGVRDAINKFFVGCKSDDIFDAIKASCILAGARTLAGALVPLVSTMPSPTNNLVSENYNRETGLLRGGSGNLESNRLSIADPRNSHHLSVYVDTNAGGLLIGAFGSGGVGDSFILAGTIDQFPFRSRIINYFPNEKGTRTLVGVTGFIGQSRNSGTQFTTRLSSTDEIISSSSTNAPASQNYVLYSGSSRISFYSIGEALDLSLLDARVSTLMSDLQDSI